MSPTSPTASAALRAVTVRLNSIPVRDLPQAAASLATCLLDTGDLLSAPEHTTPGKEKSENAILVHKLKTRLSSLLQDRNVEGRWTAVVLIKTVVELGGWEVLRNSESWIRGLIGILGRSDPSTTKKLAILVLTRIFTVSRQFPTLVREVTTPVLPSFITTSLNLISATGAAGERILKPHRTLVETVLDSFFALIPPHSTVFRPYAGQIHSILLPLIAPTPSHFAAVEIVVSEQLSFLAQKLLVSLHYCAPRNTSGEEWDNALKATLSSIHHTANQVFRAITEDWKSLDTAQQLSPTSDTYGDVVSDGGRDPLGMPSWGGLDNGTQRFVGTLHLLSIFVSQPTNSTVTLPLGAILDLTARISAVTCPCQQHDPLRHNPEITREERESLFTALPQIHTANITLYLALFDRINNGGMAIAYAVVDQVLWIFEAESWNKNIRTATYCIIRRLINLIGPSMSRKVIKSLSPVVKACCKDILPTNDATSVTLKETPTPKARQNGSSATNADSFISSTSLKALKNITSQTSCPGLSKAAWDLLPTLLMYLPSANIPLTLRAKIDQTCILVCHKQAMLASVLNPAARKAGNEGTSASILPFLARKFPGDPEIEGLLRPRMPILLTDDTQNVADDDVEEPLEDEDRNMPKTISENDNNIMETAADQSEEIAPILETPTARETSNHLGILPPSDVPSPRDSTSTPGNAPPLSASLNPAQREAVHSLATSATPSKRHASPSSFRPEAPLNTLNNLAHEEHVLKKPRYDGATSEISQVKGKGKEKEQMVQDDSDSDDEMPELNIEVDTEDDDEEV